MKPPSPKQPPASSSDLLTQGLSPSELKALVRLATPRMTKYIIQRPTEPQAAFLLADAREVLYGGAAGGGKSSAALMAALQYVDVPGYAAIIFRKTFADLAKPGALMDRAREWLGPTDAVWNEQKHSWRFPSGASLTFGHLETESAKYDHQGAEYQFIDFDELTQFSASIYRYLFSRLRRLKPKRPTDIIVPLRMRGQSNPGGVGHAWVYDRFFVQGRRKGRIFIPARLEDNPHLDAEAYEESLAELDPVTRAQLRNGDWEVKEPGEYFNRESIAIVDRAPVDASGIRWVRFWDFAASKPTKERPEPDWTAGVKIGELDGEYWVADVRRFRKDPAGTEREAQRTAELDGEECEQYFEQEPGSSGKSQASHLVRRVFKGFAAYPVRSTGDKVTRAKPLSAACANGNVKLVRGPWNSAYLDELEAFPNGSNDDQVDGSSGGFNALHDGPGDADDDVEEDPGPPQRMGLGAQRL